MALSVAASNGPSLKWDTSWVPSGAGVVSALAISLPSSSMRKRQPTGRARSRPAPEVMSSSPIVKTWWGADRARWSFRAPRSALVVNLPASANAWSFDMTRSGVSDGASGRCRGMTISSGLGLVRHVPDSAGVRVVVLEGAVGPVGVSRPRVAHADVLDPVDQRAPAQPHDMSSAAGPGDVAQDRRGLRDLGAELHRGQGVVDDLVQVLDRP